jgi:hypothetical protein
MITTVHVKKTKTKDCSTKAKMMLTDILEDSPRDAAGVSHSPRVRVEELRGGHPRDDLKIGEQTQHIELNKIYKNNEMCHPIDRKQTQINTSSDNTSTKYHK